MSCIVVTFLALLFSIEKFDPLHLVVSLCCKNSGSGRLRRAEDSLFSNQVFTSSTVISSSLIASNHIYFGYKRNFGLSKHHLQSFRLNTAKS